MTKAEISKYMASLGRKNRGRKLTPEKLAAVRLNLAKARATRWPETKARAGNGQ